MKMQADLLLVNGTVYTVDDDFAQAEAIAIKGQKILNVGSTQELRDKFIAPEIDLNGHFVYPGFIDPHCHFIALGKTYFSPDLVGTDSWQQVLDSVVKFSKSERYSNGWITGRGWDQNDWKHKHFPDNSELNRLFPETPVMLTRIDGHAAIANQKALDLANVQADAQIDGGIFELRDGKLTGLLVDLAIEEVRKAIPPDPEFDRKAALKAQEECLKVGLTSLGDAWMTQADFELFQELYASGVLKIGLYGMASSDSSDKTFFLNQGPYIDDQMRVISFKYFSDGALGSRGAALTEAYSDDPHNHGLLLHDQKELEQAAEMCYQHGFQMNTHCIGDRANRLLLDIYANNLKGKNERRWRIEHAQIVHEDDFQRFGDFSIIPSVQSTHATSDMYWADERLGEERLKNAYAYKKLLNTAGILANGSDFPIEHHNPILGFYAAVARQDLQAYPEEGFQPENKLSREEALKAMTIWAAYAQFEEQEKGSIEPGKWANLTVLDTDIMSAAYTEIPQASVKLNFVKGELVYRD